MSDRSAIEWTDATWTPIRARAAPLDNTKDGIGWYCEHVSDGCANCYAEGINKRLGTGLPFKPGHRKDIEIFLDKQMLLAPLRWKKPRMIFVCSMSDLFGSWVKDEWIDKIFAVRIRDSSDAPRHARSGDLGHQARLRAALNRRGRILAR